MPRIWLAEGGDDSDGNVHSTGEKPDHMSYYGSQRREKVIDVMTSGAFFGESALYGKPRNASVRALHRTEHLGGAGDARERARESVRACARERALKQA